MPVAKHKPTDRPDEEFRYIDISSIRSYRITDVKILKGLDAPSRARQLVRAGDTLLSTVRTYLQNTAMVPSELEGATASTGFCVLRPGPAVDPKFLFFRVLEQDFVNQLSERQTGSSYPAVRDADVRSMPTELPPLPEQHRIVEAIEAQSSRLDAAEEALRKAYQRALRMKTAVLTSRTTGWPEQRIGEFAEIYVGATPSRRRPELWGGPIPWVSSGEVAFNRIRSTRETVSQEAVRPERIHPPGTVMLAMIGEGKTRGQAAILDVAATHNQNCAALRLDASVALPEWVFYVLMSRYEETRRAGSGGNQPALNSDRIRAIYLPLPPLQEQARLVEEIDLFLTIVDKTTASLPVALRRAEELRRAVLQEAFAGRLVAQDPSDEPVSDLLEMVSS